MKITDIPIEGYERVARCIDPASGLHALIAVHDTTLGPALGGMRLWNYASADEALFDVLRLAKGMTYKSAVADTGLGGGKSVLIGDPESIKSVALFEAMGRFVNSFNGSYITAEDMNIGIEDLRNVRHTTRHVTGLSRSEGGSGNPSPYTAYGCVVGIRAAAKHKFGSEDLHGKRVLIQGVGAVGSEMARLLKERGAHVIICDIRAARVAALAAEHGYETVDDEGHHTVECDIYAPCARGAGLNDETIPALRTQIIAGCANNQLLEPRHGEALRQRGILYVPDYVINAGGIINVSVELRPGGYDEAFAIRKIDTIYQNLEQVFQIADREGIATNLASERLAERRLDVAKQNA